MLNGRTRKLHSKCNFPCTLLCIIAFLVHAIMSALEHFQASSREMFIFLVYCRDVCKFTYHQFLIIN